VLPAGGDEWTLVKDEHQVGIYESDVYIKKQITPLEDSGSISGYSFAKHYRKSPT